MKELAALMEDLGLQDVRTYIQTGNVVFRGDDSALAGLAGKIGSAVRAARGFRPDVQILTGDDLNRAIEENPFPEAKSDPKSLHVHFLASKPENPDLNRLGELKTGTERFALIDDRFYLHAPDGIARSKLASSVERLLGVSTTARNWRTVCKIAQIAEDHQ